MLQAEFRVDIDGADPAKVRYFNRCCICARFATLLHAAESTYGGVARYYGEGTSGRAQACTLVPYQHSQHRQLFDKDFRCWFVGLQTHKRLSYSIRMLSVYVCRCGIGSGSPRLPRC
jgi:hypothetical protein